MFSFFVCFNSFRLLHECANIICLIWVINRNLITCLLARAYSHRPFPKINGAFFFLFPYIKNESLDNKFID